MIAKESKHFARKYSDLSDSEKERIKKFKEICEELISIFNADNINIVSKGCPPVAPKCDYEIRIYNGDTVNYMFNDEDNFWKKCENGGFYEDKDMA